MRKNMRKKCELLMNNINQGKYTGREIDQPPVK